MKDYGFIDGQIKFADGCSKVLKESAGKSYYKDAVTAFLPSDAYVGATVDYQQTLLNKAIALGSDTSKAYADYLRALSKADK